MTFNNEHVKPGNEHRSGNEDHQGHTGPGKRDGRGRGRPSAADSNALQERILQTAEALFSTQGYAATSLRMIGEAAEVNPALVNYHFGGKLGLLEAVFDRVLEPLAEAVQGLVAADHAPPEALLELLQDLAIRHPNLLPLLVGEALLPGGAMHDAFAQRYAPRLGGLFPALLKREQSAGRLDPDADPQALTMLILSMGIFPFVAAQLAQKVIGIDLRDGGAERLARQTRALLQKGVMT